MAKTLREYCTINKYPGVTKECVESAFQSNDPKIVSMAKRFKLQGIVREKIT